MTLSQQLTEYIQACFTGIWIESHEHEDGLAEIAAMCRAEGWRCAVWDIERGLCLVQGSGESLESVGASDPLAAVRSAGGLASSDGSGMLVLVNFHRFLGSAEIVQALTQQILLGKQRRTFIVVLSPIVQIPTELQKLFVCIEHELPDREQLADIARGIATEPDELPEADALEQVLDAAAGLTRYEAEGAYSLALVRHGRIQADTLWQLKSQLLKKSGLLNLHRGRETFADLGGLHSLKAFCLQALRRREDRTVRSRGVLLLGIPGTGKSAFAKALGNETGRPTLCLDLGTLMGSLVGQTEERTRQALRIADAMSPCVLFIDELEKGLSGATGGSAGDSGVSTRMFGTLLTWLSDHESDVFVVCTANDVSRLPPEFSRAERFDGCFFLDLPAAAERQAIWRQYIALFHLDSKQQLPVDSDWTGAEIRACCRLAALLDLPLLESAKQVVPVAVTAAESVERLRTWASGRCLQAHGDGLYRRDCSERSRRRVDRN